MWERRIDDNPTPLLPLNMLLEHSRKVEKRPPGRSQRARRALLVFLAMSAAVHAVVFGVLPGLSHDPGRTPVSVLEVTVLKPETLPLSLSEPVPQPLPSTRPESRRPQAEVEPQLRPEPRAQVLALPEPRQEERHSFSVDAGFREPEPAAPEQKTQVASVAVTPHGFNAAYLRNPAPRYPVASRRAGEQGTVTLRVLVSLDGLASRVAVEKSSGSPHLDAAALEAVKAWRFTPARRGVDAVESWMLVPIVFRLEGAS
jgi:protein TonB